MFYLNHHECVEFCGASGWNSRDGFWTLDHPTNLASISFLISRKQDEVLRIFRDFISLLAHPGGLSNSWLFWPSNNYHVHVRDPLDYHLYYKVRQSYMDFGQLSATPGHLFLQHEENDLLTFVRLAFLFGWDFHLICDEWGVIHNDECVGLYAEENPFFENVKQALTRRDIDWQHGDRT